MLLSLILVDRSRIQMKTCDAPYVKNPTEIHFSRKVKTEQR